MASPSRTARSALNELLLQSLNDVLATTPHADFFNAPVSVVVVNDYFTFIEPGQEMDLSQISARAESQYYGSVEEFRTDVERIHSCAVAYNSKGKGKHAYEPVIHWAKDLLEAMDQQLGLHQGRLSKLQQELQASTSNASGGNEVARSAPPPAEAPNTSVPSPARDSRSQEQATESDSQLGSAGSAPVGSGLDALLAACELARETDTGAQRPSPRAASDSRLVATAPAGPVGAATYSAGKTITEDGLAPVQQQEVCSRGFGVQGQSTAVAVLPPYSRDSNAFKHRRHKSKVYIKPNKVVYLPTTFAEEEFDIRELPLDCELLVDADGVPTPETYQVTIKAVPRQGLSTMYCMTNVMRFQQRYLHWQITDWTRNGETLITVHLQCPTNMPKPDMDRLSSFPPEVPRYRRSEEGHLRSASGLQREPVSLKRKSDTGRYGHHLNLQPDRRSSDGRRLDHQQYRPSPIPESPPRSPVSHRQVSAPVGRMGHHMPSGSHLGLLQAYSSAPIDSSFLHVVLPPAALSASVSMTNYGGDHGHGHHDGSGNHMGPTLAALQMAMYSHAAALQGSHHLGALPPLDLGHGAGMGRPISGSSSQGRGVSIIEGYPEDAEGQDHGEEADASAIINGSRLPLASPSKRFKVATQPAGGPMVGGGSGGGGGGGEPIELGALRQKRGSSGAPAGPRPGMIPASAAEAAMAALGLCVYPGPGGGYLAAAPGSHNVLAQYM